MIVNTFGTPDVDLMASMQNFNIIWRRIDPDLGPSALVPLTLDDPSVKVFKIHDLAPFTLAKSFQKSSVKV